MAAIKLKSYFAPPKLVAVQLADGTAHQTVIAQKVELIRCGTVFDARYGKLEITAAMLKSFVVNFNEKIRKIDLAVDYKHDSDSIAAGWIKNIYFDDNSGALYAEIDWTSNGKRVLVDKEFRYISAEFNLDYQDNQSLKKFGPTLLGAGLTNRPVIKGMEPIVPLSEGDSGMQVMSAEDMTKALMAMQAAVEKLQNPSAAPGLTPPPGDQTANPPPAKLDAGTGDNENEDEGDGTENPPAPDDTQGDDMDLKKQLADLQAANADLTKKCADLEAAAKAGAQDKALAEKNKKFDVMLSEKKAVEGQRKAYLDGDMEAFTAAAVALVPKTTKIGLSEAQAGGAAIDAPVDPQKELLKLADAKVADKSAPNKMEAISMVLSDPANKALREQYERRSMNVSLAGGEDAAE